MKFCWMWVFPWIKPSWQSCSLWDKLEWLNLFWQFLCEGLYSFNPNGFYYSSICMVLQLMWKKDVFLHGTYLQKTFQILTYVFNWIYFTQCLTSFFSINHFFLCTVFLSCFIQHRWGSLDQPICWCICLFLMYKAFPSLADLFWWN